MQPAGRRSERGVTLIEILVTIAILSIASAALLGAVSTIAITSRGHTDQARAESVLNSAAERVRDPLVSHAPCAAADNAAYLAAARSATLPDAWTSAGWTPADAITITSIRYWDGDTFGATCYDTTALGHLLTLQLITVRVTPPDGQHLESVSVVKAAA